MSEAEEIAAFLAARLDEDEEDAREAMNDLDGNWSYTDTPGGNHKVTDRLGYSVSEHYDVDSAPWFTGRHIARHDPARVLREVEAGRKLLREHERLIERKASHEAHLRAAPHYTPFTAPGYPSAYDLQREGHFLEQALPLARGLVAAKAAVYSDHPDYRQAWKP